MTEQDTGATEVPEREIEFMGRKIWVTMPSAEQLLVWQRTLKKLQGADVSDWNAEQVMISLERLRKILDSMVLNQVDIEWFDDEMLAGRLTFKNMLPLVTLTVDAFADAAEAEGNRETRRAKKAAPAKKATRKRA
jgi:hypothetical protein